MRERGKRGASRRIVSVLLAVLLLVTSIPMDGVYAAEANTVQSQVPEETGTANIGEATNDATSDKTNENTTINGVGTPPVENDDEKGGEESPAGDGTPEDKKDDADASQPAAPAEQTSTPDGNGAPVAVSLGDAVPQAESGVSTQASTYKVTVNNPEVTDEDAYTIESVKLTYDDSGTTTVVPDEGVVANTAVTVSVKVKAKDEATKYIKSVTLTEVQSGSVSPAANVTLQQDSSDSTLWTGTVTPATADLEYDLSVEVADKLTVTATADATNKSYVKVTFDKLVDDETIPADEGIFYVEPSKTVTIKANVALTDAPEGSVIDEVKFVDGNTSGISAVTLKDEDEDGVYEGEATVSNASVEGTIKVTVKEGTTVAFDADKDVVNLDSIYAATPEVTLKVDNQSPEQFFVGDEVTIACDDTNFKIASVTFDGEEIKPDASGAYKVTLKEVNLEDGIANKLSVKVALDYTKVAVVNFSGKGYKATVGTDVVNGKTVLVHETDKITVEAFDDHYVINDNGVTADDTSVTFTKNSDAYEHTVTALTSEKALKVINVSVSTKKVNNLTITNPDTKVTSIKLYKSTDLDTELTKTSTSYVIDEGTDLTVIMTLTDATYEFSSIDLVGEDGKVTSYLGKPIPNDNLSADKSIEFALKLDKLTSHSTLTVRASLKDGYVVSFAGDHYTAKEGSNQTEYSKDYSYKIGKDSLNADLEFTLTPEAGYRFTGKPTVKSTAHVTIEDGSVTGTYKVTVKKEYFSDKTKKLEITAKTEKTATLTIPNVTDATVKVYTKSVADSKDVTVSNSNAYVVAANAKVIVAITAANSKKVDKVTLTKSTAEPVTLDSLTGSKGNYKVTIDSLDQDATLIITTEEDAALMTGITFKQGHYTVSQQNDNNFNSNAHNDKLSFTSFVDNQVLQDKLVKLVGTTANEKVYLKVTPDNGYKIKTIKFGSATLYDSSKTIANAELDTSDNTTIKLSDVTLTVGKQPDFVVTTETTASTDAVNVKFTFASEHKVQGLKYAYFTPKTELQLSDYAVNKNITLPKGTKDFSFTVTAPDGVTPTITFDKNNENVIADVTNAGNVYTFTVSAAALDSAGAVITLDGEVETKKITFVYHKNDLSLTHESNPLYTEAIASTVDVDKDGNSIAKTTYTLRKNAELTVNLNAQQKYKEFVTEITGIDNGASFTSEYASFDLVANSDQTITISSKALENAYVTSGDELVSKNEDGAYVVNYKKNYTAAHFTGTVRSEVTKAELVVDGKTVSEFLATEDGNVLFSLDETYAGKQAVLNLQKVETKDGKEVVTTVAAINLSVCKPLTTITVATVGEDNILTQTVDTTKEYALTLSEGASFEDLYVSFTNCEAEKAVLEDGSYVLRVTTPASKAAEKAASIELVNENDNTLLKTITVNTVAVKGLTEAVPSVSYVNGTDKDLVVKLAASGVEAVKTVTGGIYYKVSVTPVSGEGDKPEESVYYVEKVGSEQTATLENVLGLIPDENGNYEAGRPYTFSLKVQLVQLDNQQLDTGFIVDEDTNRLDVSKESDAVSGFATKKPYYSSEVTLTQLEQVVYIGQEDVTIATADFGKDASFISGDAVILEDEDFVVEVNADGSVILPYVYLETGTYTLVVSAQVPENTISASASLTFKVENGVFDVAIKNLPETIFKADDKAAKVKATAELNYGDVKGLKNKKVTWAISKTNLEKDEAGNPIIRDFASTDHLYNAVTVKNGNITIDKSYKVSSIKENNMFYVVAIPDGNPKAATAQKVEITKESATLGELHFAIEDNGKYTALAEKEDLTTITSDVANSGDLCLIAVKEGVVKSVYTEKDLLQTSLSLKAPKTVSLYDTQTTDGVFYINGVSKTAKNMKFVVSTMDGGKSAKTELLTVNYTDISNLKVKIGNTVYGNTPYTFTGTTEDVLSVFIGTEKVENGITTFVPFEGQANVKVSIKGGKLVKSPAVDSTHYLFKITSAEAKLTIVNKDDKNKATNTTVCEIINKGFSKTAAPAVNASVKSLLSDSIEEQTITYKFKKDAAYKFVKVQFNADDVAKQKTTALKKFGFSDTIYNDLDWVNDEQILPIADNSFTVDFTNADSGVREGTVKLAFTYGNYDEAGNFVPETKAAGVSVKFAPLKKASYAPQEAYALSLKDTVSTTLTGVDGKDTKAYYDDTIYNTVVNGEANAFTTYFDVEDGNLVIKKLTGDNADELMTNLKAMVGKEDKNLTGYVGYRINGIAGGKLAKVTVSLKDTIKAYEASTKTLLTATGITTDLNLTYDGKDVKVLDAASLTNAFDAETVDNHVVLTSKTLVAGANAAKVAFIPESSYYATYGVEDVTVNTDGAIVEFTANAVSSAKDIITISNNAISFTDYANGIYTGELPYTSNIANNVSFTVKDTETVKLNGIVEFEAKDGKIVASISKTELEAGSAEYGKSYDVTVTANFGIANADADYTFKVTMPSKSKVDATAVETIFTNIRKAVWNLPNETDNNNNTVDGQKFPASIDFTEVYEAMEKMGDTIDNDKLKELYSTLSTDAVLAAAKAVIPVGADIDVSVDAATVTNTVSLPSNGKDGSLTVALKFSGDDYTNNQTSTKVDSTTHVIPVTVVLPAVNADAMMGAKLTAFANANNIKKVITNATNSITEDDILKVVRANVLGAGDESYRILSEDNFKLTAATDAKAGNATVTVYVKNIYTAEKVANAQIKVTISKLQSVSDAAAAFNTAFGEFIKTAKPNTTANEILTLAKSVIKNSDIKVEFAKDGAFTITTKDATTQPTGAAKQLQVADSMKFTLVYSNSKNATANVAIDEQLEKTDYTDTSVDIVSLVENALTGNDTDNNNQHNSLQYINNHEAESKANLLEAANKAIENAPYTVKFDAWAYKAPTSTVDGSLSYTLSFEAINSSVKKVTDKITVVLTLPASGDYQTLDEAVAAVEKAFKDLADYTQANLAKYTADKIKTAMSEYVKDSNAADGRKLVLRYKQDIDQYFSKYDNVFTVVEPTVKKDGSVSLTFVIEEQKQNGNTWETVASKELKLTKTIKRTTQDVNAAKIAVNSALADITFTDKTTAADILSAVREVLDTSIYKYVSFGKPYKYENGTKTGTLYVRSSLSAEPTDTNAGNFTIELS